MKLIHMLVSLATAIFYAPPDDKSGEGDIEEGAGDLQQQAKENADLAERFAATGKTLPDFPAGPAGLAKAREYMKKELEKGDDEEGEEEETETAEELASSMTKDDLLELAEEEGVSVNTSDNKADIAEAIVAARKTGAGKEGTTGSPQTGDK